jgi:protein disulfide-isomerase A1
VRGYPTIKLFRGGEDGEYNGGRSAAEIVSWMKKKSGPSVKTLTTQDDLTTLQTQFDVVVLGFIDVESDEGKAFLSVAEKIDTVGFGIGTELSTSLEAEPNSLILLKPFDEKRSEMKLDSSTTEEDISEFVMGSSSPLVQFFSSETSSKIFGSKIQVHILFFTDSAQEYHKHTLVAFTELAKTVRGKALVVNIPSSEQRVLDFFDVKPEDLPAAHVADMRTDGVMKKYKFEDDITAAESLKSYVQDFFDGKLQPALKSEEVAPEDTAGDVVVVKGKSFQDIVVNNSNDVFVEFYAPWCGHCKKLEPVWNELAQKFRVESKVVIAKMDATANEIDVPGVSVKGFPTLIYFQGSDKSTPIVYDGARDLDGLTKFVEEKAGLNTLVEVDVNGDEL